jgi:hypothetical protein
LSLPWILPTRLSSCRRPAVVALHAEHATGAGIGIEPQHTSIRREPFQAVMGFAVRTDIRPLDIGKGSGPFSAYAVQNLIERADFARLHTFAGTIRLCRCRFGNRGCADQKQTYQRRKVPHGPPFTAESLNST